MSDDVEVRTVQLDLCDLCIRGEGGECHVPGCTLWINRAPDLRIDTHPSFTLVPAPTVDGADELRQRIGTILCEHPVDDLVNGLMAVVRPLLAERDAAVERAETAEARLDLANRDYDYMSGCAETAEANLAAARQQLDQVRALARQDEAGGAT